MNLLITLEPRPQDQTWMISLQASLNPPVLPLNQDTLSNQSTNQSTPTPASLRSLSELLLLLLRLMILMNSSGILALPRRLATLLPLLLTPNPANNKRTMLLQLTAMPKQWQGMALFQLVIAETHS